MTLKKLINRGRTGLLLRAASLSMMLVAALCLFPFVLDSTGNTVAFAADQTTSSPARVGQRTDEAVASPVDLTAEQRIEEIEKTLQSIKNTDGPKDDRSYDIKMMSRELIRYVRLVVVALVVIAVVFPLTIWIMSKKRILGLSGLSPELATTLLLVEERQAKLAHILKEIQGEIDYLHTMSVPDLKNLIQQAENYLKQNEADLEKTGRRGSKAEKDQT
ncbi:MAG: hypothetical protein HY913_10755 [Desulfomonile tiedjei]|nr:hypothetical protein [Desulfomonile tiedjei]